MEAFKIFSLEELLDGEITMVIPDMQRDYCWGDKTIHDLPSVYKVTTFVKGILHLYGLGQSSVLGLIYGYEQPVGSNRINVIDGQQRLTTLFLLVGMLYRRTSSQALRQMLISDYQLIDNREPRILYQTRREAFYFMSDLVMHFFLNRDGRLSMLEKSKWYYVSYDSDPSVQSFISALRLIDEALEEAAADEGFDFDDFANFVRQNIKFLYCGFHNRAAAERTFITINTTGEPLTLSQKMRSLSVALSSSTEVAQQWNDIEDWFWYHRHTSDIDKIVQLYLSTIKGSDFSTDDLFDFFNAYKRLAESCQHSSPTPIGADYNFVGEFAILPTITYIRRYGPQATPSNIRRLCHLLCNIARYQRPAPSGSDTVLAIEMASGMRNPDLLEIMKWHQAPRRIINDEERAKLDFIKQHQEERETAEELIAIAECHPAINGRASKVLPWCDNNLEKLRHYLCKLYQLFGLEMPSPNSTYPNLEEIDKQPGLDLLRRALLTVKHPEYPIVRRGDTVLSLCWNDYDWQRLLQNAPGLIRHVIDRCDTGLADRHPYETFRDMINRFSNTAYPYFFIIKNEETIGWARKRQLLHPSSAFLGIYDIQKVHPRWWIEQFEIRVDASQWQPLRVNGSKCLYTDHLDYDLSISIHHTPEEKHKYRLEVYSRQTSSDNVKRPFNLKKLIQQFDRYFMYDQHRNRFFAVIRTAQETVTLFHSITKSLPLT